MIEIKIIQNFEGVEVFKDLSSDYNGKVNNDNNTITFPDHTSFTKVLNLLVPVFLPPKIRQYLDFKEIKNENTDKKRD